MIGIVGNRGGFREPGGVRKLVQLLCQRLEIEQFTYHILTAKKKSERDCSSLIMVGCSSPWAYGVALKSLIRRPALPIHWIPCFHPPRYVTHPWKARFALWALRGLQMLGVHVYALTQAEHTELNAGRCALLSLPFDSEEAFQVQALKHMTPIAQRPLALVFLGRPVSQKGWPQYLAMVSHLGLNSLALVPFAPEGKLPRTLTVKIGLHDHEVREHLDQCQLLILPSDYESFGFAQAEALLSGCCVPVLGEWPLWLKIAELDWRQLTPWQAAERVRTLLKQPATLASLQKQQLQAWMNLPERQAPILPDLREIDAEIARRRGTDRSSDRRNIHLTE